MFHNNTSQFIKSSAAEKQRCDIGGREKRREDTVPYKNDVVIHYIENPYAECAARAAGDEFHTNMFTVIMCITFVRLIPALCPK